jgi:hypothetical protein
MSLQHVLNDTPVASIDAAIAVMNALGMTLPDNPKRRLELELRVSGSARLVTFWPICEEFLNPIRSS